MLYFLHPWKYDLHFKSQLAYQFLHRAFPVAPGLTSTVSNCSYFYHPNHILNLSLIEKILQASAELTEAPLLNTLNNILLNIETHQFTSVAQSCLTLCHPMNRSMPGLPVHHQLPEFTQIHVHRLSDSIQPSHPRSLLSPPAPNPSQHQSLFQWVNSSHEVTKVLEFQL